MPNSRIIQGSTVETSLDYKRRLWILEGDLMLKSARRGKCDRINVLSNSLFENLIF